VAALAALAIIAAIEAGVAMLSPRLHTWLDVATVAKRARLVAREKREEVAIFGDSRMFSVRPAVVAEALGGNVRAANYAWPFAGIETYDYMLDAYLHYNPPPRLILVDLMPDYVALNEATMRVATIPEHRIRLFNIVPGVPLAEKLAADRQWSLLWGFLTYRFASPTMRYREPIKDVLLEAIGEGRRSATEPDAGQIAASLRARGAFVLAPGQVAGPEAIGVLEQKPYGPIGPRPPDILRPFERFLARGRENSIRVLLLNPPMPEPLFARYDGLGVLAHFRAQLDRLRQTHANFEILEPAVHTLPIEFFSDAGHVNARGDEALHTSIRERLAEYARRGMARPGQ